MRSLWNNLRSVIIFTVLLVLTGVLTFIHFPLYFFNKDFYSIMLRYAVGKMGLYVGWIFGVRYQIMGKVPNYNCIIAANHAHYFDTATLASLTTKPGITFFAKTGLKWIPSSSDFIFLARDGSDRDFMRQARREFGKGKSILIFPQGTRTRMGEDRAYSNGGAMIARHLNAEVLPISHNTGEVFTRDALLGFGLTKKRNIYVKIHQPVKYHEVVFKSLYNQHSGMKVEPAQIDIRKLKDAMSMMKCLDHDEIRLKLINQILNMVNDISLSKIYLRDEQILIEELREVIDLPHLPYRIREEVKSKFIDDLKCTLCTLEIMDKTSNPIKDRIFTAELKSIIDSGLDEVSKM